MRGLDKIGSRRELPMTAMEFDLKGRENEGRMRVNLKRVGAGSDLPIENRVQALQQTVAELLTALQKANIKTDV
jgi:hypothetical protein